ncbi:hypothetical protein NDU88_003715 [Pleurodeles waltl]|uniref:Uncharacterized protein n=1 Tax=Pleurodeles waltl TaxID=8319 RepID=A0AAV7W8A7_PLEWA|nr:hypothetical protein NDU88_003715 [Pleurodeles waltl]
MIAPRHRWGPVPLEDSTVQCSLAGPQWITLQVCLPSSTAARRAETARPFHTAPRGGATAPFPRPRTSPHTPWGRPRHTSDRQDPGRLPESKGTGLQPQMLRLPGVPQPHGDRPGRLPPGPSSGPLRCAHLILWSGQSVWVTAPR